MAEELTTQPTAADAQSVVNITIDRTPLTTDQARQLTNTIRDAAEVLWVLIARAHAGKAWTALGYDSWEHYVREEFNMSRSRSYQLLDQARVIAAVEAVVPEGTEVHITEAAARDLKSVIEDAVPEIKEKTAGLPADEATSVLDDILAEHRDRATGAIPDSPSLGSAVVNDDFFEEYGGSETSPLTAGLESVLVHTSESDPASSVGSLTMSPTPASAAPAAPLPEVDAVDVTRIRRNVNAAHDLYSSLSALAGLPDELDEVVAIIPAERRQVIQGNLARAQANLERFAQLWEEKSDESQQ